MYCCKLELCGTVLFIVVCVDRVNTVRTYFARGSGHVTRYGTNHARPNNIEKKMEAKTSSQ